MSAEPSMEDILASIKRIIAEDAESGVPVRARRRPAPQPVEPFVDDDDILELNQPALDTAEPDVEPIAEAARSASVQPAPMSPPPAPEKPQIVSAQTAQASRAPLDTLSRLVVKPDAPGSDTLEGLVREMLRPMLSNWLDKNLPALVESMVAREIARITSGR